MIPSLLGLLAARRVPAAAPPATPDALPGLHLWLQPPVAGGNVALEDATRVVRWDDASGRANHVTQASGSGLRPFLDTGALAGVGAIRFDRNAGLENHALAPLFHAEDYAVHVAFDTDNASATAAVFGATTAATPVGQSSLWFGTYRGDLVYRHAGQALRVIQPATSGQPHVASLVKRAGLFQVWIDGVRRRQDEDFGASPAAIDRFSLGRLIGGALNGTQVEWPGDIAEALVYDRGQSDAEIRAVQRHLLKAYRPDVPAEIDLFMGTGQSNMQGNAGNASPGGPAIAPGVAFVWDGAAVVPLLGDPVGGAKSGSLVPAFVNRWHALTGRQVLYVEQATGGTALLAAADAGNGNWSPTGTLYGNAVAAWHAARAALDGTAAEIGTAGVLWLQGESDAIAHDGNAVSAATYQPAMQALITDFQRDLAGLDAFLAFELGERNPPQPAIWANIRDAQNAAIAATPGAHLISTLPRTFQATGRMHDLYHYTQAGYDALGEDGAINAHALVAS